MFAEPTPASIAWANVEAMLMALGAEISEGRGSRLRVSLKGVDAVFHRPHPAKEASRGAVRSLRRFLTATGIETP